MWTTISDIVIYSLTVSAAFKDPEENYTSRFLPSDLHVQVQFWINLNIRVAVGLTSLCDSVTLTRALFQSLIDCADGGERLLH